MKKQKMEEIVTLLDLFDGKVTLSELLSTDISLLNQLRDAKISLLEKQNRNTVQKEGSTKGLKIIGANDYAELVKHNERKVNND